MARGVGAGTVVGICMHRSTEFIAAVLGVLKAVLVFPLPGSPSAAERLADIAKDSGMKLLLSEDALLGLGQQG